MGTALDAQLPLIKPYCIMFKGVLSAVCMHVARLHKSCCVHSVIAPTLGPSYMSPPGLASSFTSMAIDRSQFMTRIAT